MATPNIFDLNLFSLMELTASVNNQPYVPTRIGDLGWFEEKGSGTLDVWIEEREGKLSLLPVQPRGSSGYPETQQKRKGFNFRIPHIPARAHVLADQVNFVRDFNTESGQRTVQSVVDEVLMLGKRDIDYTKESHRLLAVMGQWKDHNDVTQSLFTKLEVEQQIVKMDLTNTNPILVSKAMAVKRAIKSGLGGITPSTVRVLCGDNFWDMLRENAEFRDAFKYSPFAQALINNPTESVPLFGMTWEWYSGTADVQIPPDEAYAVPEGIPGLFLTRNAPADILQAVGTMGLPYYAIPETLSHGKGIDIEMQANPLNICARPRAVIRLKKGTS